MEQRAPLETRISKSRVSIQRTMRKAITDLEIQTETLAMKSYVAGRDLPNFLPLWTAKIVWDTMFTHYDEFEGTPLDLRETPRSRTVMEQIATDIGYPLQLIDLYVKCRFGKFQNRKKYLLARVPRYTVAHALPPDMYTQHRSIEVQQLGELPDQEQLAPINYGDPRPDHTISVSPSRLENPDPDIDQVIEDVVDFIGSSSVNAKSVQFKATRDLANVIRSLIASPATGQQATLPL
jgi:hypothetical protein